MAAMDLITIVINMFSLSWQWAPDAAVQGWIAVAVVAGWFLIRFNSTIRRWLISTLRWIIVTILEMLIVGWGVLVIATMVWNKIYCVFMKLNTTNFILNWSQSKNVDRLLFAVSGGILVVVGFCISSHLNGSGAGKQNQNVMREATSSDKKNKQPIDKRPIATVISTPTTPIDESMQSLFQHDVGCRLVALEKLVNCVLNKLSDFPSIDLLAASIQNVNDNIEAEGGHTRSVFGLEPPLLAAIKSSVHGGNPLLNDEISVNEGSTQCNKKRGIQRNSQIFISGNDTNSKPLTKVYSEKPPVERITENMLKEFVGINKDEFFKRVSQLSREDRESKRKPGVLNMEEQELGKKSLRDLDIKWMNEAFRLVKPMHMQDIGTLTPEEATFSRNSVREIIRQRRHENWVENMRKKGVTLFICPDCNTTTTEGHRCFATSWNSKIKRGPFNATKEMLFTQQGRGAIKLQEQMRLDQDHLSKSYQKLHEKKHLLTSQENHAQALQMQRSSNKQYQDNMETTDTQALDIEMEVESQGGQKGPKASVGNALQQQIVGQRREPLGALILGKTDHTHQSKPEPNNFFQAGRQFPNLHNGLRRTSSFG